MKIHRKLFFACLLNSGLMLSLGFLSIQLNQRIEQKIIKSQMTKTELFEIQEAKFLLNSHQTLLYQILSSVNLPSSPPRTQAKTQPIRVLAQKLDQNLNAIEQHLTIIQESNKAYLRVYNTVNSDKSESKKIAKSTRYLKQLGFILNDYKTLGKQVVGQSQQRPIQTTAAIMDLLNSPLYQAAMSLIEQYESDVKTQITKQTQDITAAIEYKNRIMLLAAGSAFLMAVLLSKLVAQSIARPLQKLAQTAQGIQPGQIVPGSAVPKRWDGEADELASLTVSLHQIAEALVNTTALQSYVEHIFGSMADALIVIDANATILKVNPATLRLLGYTEAELVGQSIALAFGINQASQLQQLTHQGFIGMLETLFQSKDGRQIPVSFSSAAMQNAAGACEMVCVVRDITSQKQMEAALRESEARYALAAQGANDGLWDWDLRTANLYLSPRWKEMLGWQEHELESHLDAWFGRVHPEDVSRLRRRLESHLEGTTAHFESEHRILHRNGSYRWMLSRGLAVRDGSGIAYRIAGSQTDITERKLAEQQLLHGAFHDGLTGLPNRALFKDRLSRVMARANRHPDGLFAVLLLDLDRFKVINDSLGHVTGDQLLLMVATRLKQALQPTDTIARLGGDEFAILLDDRTMHQEIVDIASDLLKVISQPLDLDGHQVSITASIGISLNASGYERPEEMLRDADIAMYRAKAQGKCCYQFFDSSMHIRAVTLLQLESDLRRALDRQEFCLCYQPIVSLATGLLLGFEALIRWKHQHYGWVSPNRFIPLAEETGLIVPLGLWVMQEACQQMRSWQQSYGTAASLEISVNLSSKQILQPGFIEQVQEILQTTQLPGRALKLEITESIIFENAELANYRLLQLKSLGVRTALDDFGTGFSSLSYLYRLPIDTLKIDRSFIQKVEHDARKLELVRTIIALASNLNMGVVAEGVETAQQLSQLRALQCEAGQGYLFAKPLNQMEAEMLIRSHTIAPNETSSGRPSHYNRENCTNGKVHDSNSNRNFGSR